MDFRPEFSWEFLSDDEITSKTIRALRNHIRYVKEVSSYYRTALKHVNPEEITSLEDFAGLPFTTRKDLAATPAPFLCASSDEIVETVATAGTCGRPLPFFYTASDLKRAEFSAALAFNGIKTDRSDRAALVVSLDRFSIDGCALYRGAVAIGANCMRLGIGLSAHTAIRNYFHFFKPTLIAGSATALKTIALELSKKEFDSSKVPISKLVCIGESLRTRDLRMNSTGRTIESLWGAEAFSFYLSTELSVVYGECLARNGCHAHPELVYTEIVDDEGTPLPDGEVGELTATTLGVEGMPLVRYRTGDITFKLPGHCSCGRNSCRIGPILGRRSQIFTCNGKVVYPYMLTDELDKIDDIKDYLIIIDKDERQADVVTIQAAAPPNALEKITQAVRESTGIHIPVLLSNIPTIEGLRKVKASRTSILDNRGG